MPLPDPPTPQRLVLTPSSVYLVERDTKFLLVALQYICLSLGKCFLAFTHTHGAVFLGAVGILSPKALNRNFRLAILCLQDASRALVFPPEMGQVLAPPTYLKVLLCDPEEIFGDIYTRPGTREGVFLSLLTQSNGNIVRKDNANLKKLVAQTFCLK